MNLKIRPFWAMVLKAMIKLTLLGLGAALLALPALAQTASPNPNGANQRFDRQQQRINQGEATGQLTKGEAGVLAQHLSNVPQRTKFHALEAA